MIDDTWTDAEVIRRAWLTCEVENPIRFAEIADRIEAMDAEIAELRKDKARLDWLEANKAELSCYAANHWRVFTIDDGVKPKCETARMAIDYAMELSE